MERSDEPLPSETRIPIETCTAPSPFLGLGVTLLLLTAAAGLVYWLG
jgi:hypothetical protein